MQFPNQSKSLLPISRETLLDMAVQFGKNIKKIRRYGELSAETYPLYVTEITGYRPCSICNGPRGFVKLDESRIIKILFDGHMMERQTLAIYSPLRCLKFPVHSLIENSADPLSNWSRVSINLCDHGYYFIECNTCHENLEKCKETPWQNIVAVTEAALPLPG